MYSAIVVHWCGRLEGLMVAGRGIKSRAFSIYYAQTPNPKEKAKKPKSQNAKKPKLILCPANPPSEKLKIRYSYSKNKNPAVVAWW